MEINFVTGGTGFLGKYLIKGLLESGKNVLVVVRPFHGVSTVESGNLIKLKKSCF